MIFLLFIELISNLPINHFVLVDLLPDEVVADLKIYKSRDIVYSPISLQEVFLNELGLKKKLIHDIEA